MAAATAGPLDRDRGEARTQRAASYIDYLRNGARRDRGRRLFDAGAAGGGDIDAAGLGASSTPSDAPIISRWHNVDPPPQCLRADPWAGDGQSEAGAAGEKTGRSAPSR